MCSQLPFACHTDFYPLALSVVIFADEVYVSWKQITRSFFFLIQPANLCLFIDGLRSCTWKTTTKCYLLNACHLAAWVLFVVFSPVVLRSFRVYRWTFVYLFFLIRFTLWCILKMEESGNSSYSAGFLCQELPSLVLSFLSVSSGPWLAVISVLLRFGIHSPVLCWLWLAERLCV